MRYNRLLAVCVISCMFLCSPVFAAGADSDVSKLGTPTLDSLAGQEIPDGDGAVYPNSGYTLTEVTPEDVSTLPDNVITKYEIKEVTKYYDPTTGAEVAESDRLPDVEYKEVVTKETIPHYYKVNLAQTTYGQGDKQIIYNWAVNDDGQYILEEGASATGNNSIIFNYSDADLQSRIEHSAIDSTPVSGTFIGITTSSFGGAISNY